MTVGISRYGRVRGSTNVGLRKTITMTGPKVMIGKYSYLCCALSHTGRSLLHDRLHMLTCRPTSIAALAFWSSSCKYPRLLTPTAVIRPD
jgi:hypothetical protein